MATAQIVLQALNDEVIGDDIHITSDFYVGASQVQVLAGAAKSVCADANVVGLA